MSSSQKNSSIIVRNVPPWLHHALEVEAAQRGTSKQATALAILANHYRANQDGKNPVAGYVALDKVSPLLNVCAECGSACVSDIYYLRVHNNGLTSGVVCANCANKQIDQVFASGVIG